MSFEKINTKQCNRTVEIVQTNKRKSQQVIPSVKKELNVSLMLEPSIF